MRQIPRTIQIQAGLLSVLALNTTLLETAQQQEQAQAVGVPAKAASGPLYVPTADSTAWQRNVGKFLQLLAQPSHSQNPYNNHVAFAHAPVLWQGWREVPDNPTPAPGRGGFISSSSLAGQLAIIIGACGYDKNCPVLLDRAGRVLDGYHRLLACRMEHRRAYIVQLDF